MLRITPFGGNEEQKMFKLEGRLVDPWVNLLEEACQQHLRDADVRLTLDLSGVEFASPGGIDLLRRLGEQGVSCIHLSAFLRTLWE
jgi:hypothetical protein